MSIKRLNGEISEKEKKKTLAEVGRSFHSNGTIQVENQCEIGLSIALNGIIEQDDKK